MLELTPRMLDGIPKNGPTDPIEYYRRPLVGRIFRERINRGLRLLPERRFARALEVGYGAGAVLLSLAPGVDELHGLDLDADPKIVTGLLESRGLKAALRQGSVYELPYETDSFDLVVSFSMFEHLHEYPKGLSEVARVLRPGGLFLLGMPAVNRLMEAGFLAIGFKGINAGRARLRRRRSATQVEDRPRFAAAPAAGRSRLLRLAAREADGSCRAAPVDLLANLLHIGVDHHPHQLLEADLRRPAELLLGLGRVTQQ
jgi:SAM-dependent methyltransferase